TWEPLHDPRKGMKEGMLHFLLHGQRLKGGWALVRMRPRPKERSENWLLIKENDEEASRRKDILKANETSVKSGRAMKEIAEGRKSGKSVWHSKVSAEGKLPKFRPVQLATPVDKPPEGRDWVHELKYDGYRCLIAVGGGRIVCWTRNELDWTEKFSALLPAIEQLKVTSALIDGEVVAANEEGRSDFGALQHALKEGGRLSYFAFDLLELNGEDLGKRALLERKQALRKIIGRGVAKTLFYSEHIQGNGAEVLQAVCAKGGEGIISKLADAPYRGTRSKGWLKIKCGNVQEFVIGGWTPSDRRIGFRSLLIGVYEGKEFIYAGRVGTGFDSETLGSLGEKLKTLQRKTSPFKAVPREVSRAARWAEPKLVAEIEFAEFTRDGVLRHPSFKGLREDKPARKVKRERTRKTPE
ncbi:MAG: non-homologous end-joining DNA ligase, partial [Parvibaculaceae bacterium]